MRLFSATAVAALAVAIVAMIFAIWPVVADAPWEPEPISPTPQVQPTPSQCEILAQGLANAGDWKEAYIIEDVGERLGCW